jgi:site-specific DNA-methyltransferase (adenine-specific)/adenine-specific DNA-methyltransferase
MPVLDWIGKAAVVRHHKDVPYRLLEAVPELSCNSGDGTSENLIVQGDNLHALKALLPRYAGQVKCIYIDPPYNTGNEGWAYNDNVNSPEIRRWLGELVGKEGETLDRHDRWLCMMYPRLVLLRQFLRDDGVIFISIDDNEVHHLRSLANEIGGLKFVGTVVWERKRKGSHLSKKLTKKTEYIVILSRKSADLELIGEDVGQDEDFPLVKRTNGLKDLHIPFNKLGPTGLPDGTYAAGTYGRGGTSVTLLQPATVALGSFTSDVFIRGPFVWTQGNLDSELNAGGRCFLRTPNFSLRAVKGSDSQGQKGLSSLLTKEVGTNEDASAELAEILQVDLNSVFQYSKPTNLVRTLIRAATFYDKDALCLDSFAGSGTTGHAVMMQNAEDGGTRRFVLIEMDDGIATTVTSERVRRVARGYSNSKGDKVPGLGGGFQFCRLGETTMFAPDGDIRENVGFDDLAEFIWFSETGSGRVRGERREARSPFLGLAGGKAILLLYNGILADHGDLGGNVLNGRTLEVLKREVGTFDGPWVVYGARTRFDASRLARLGIEFKLLPYRLQEIAWA